MSGRTAILTTSLAALLLAAGCREDPPAAPAPVPAPAIPDAPPAPAAEPSTEALDAGSASPQDAGDRTSDAGPGEAATEPDAPDFPEGPAGDLRRALHAVADCDRREGSIRVSDPDSCLAALRAARAVLRDPPADVAPTPEAREALREEHVRALREALDHEDPTVVLYALMHHQSDFDDSPRTAAYLEQHMDSEHRDVAEWAAVARFWQRGGTTGATAELARETLTHHRHDRVRLAACEYLGDATFRGDREHFDLLLERAGDGDEVAAIRSCAVTRLGYVGSDEDIPTIAAFLDRSMTQAAAVVALQRGLRSERGLDAWLRWFEAHAAEPDVIQWRSVAVFLPRGDDLATLPRERAAAILETIATNEGLHPKARALAIEHLGTLGDAARLQGLRRTYDAPDAEVPPDVRQAIERALSQ